MYNFQKKMDLYGGPLPLVALLLSTGLFAFFWLYICGVLRFHRRHHHLGRHYPLA